MLFSRPTRAPACWASSGSAAIPASRSTCATRSSTRRSRGRSISQWATASPSSAGRTRAPSTGTWSRTSAAAARSTSTASSSRRTAAGCPEKLGRRGLRKEDPAQDQRAAAPAAQAEPVAGDRIAEDPGEHRFQREDERDPGGTHPPLRPDLNEDRECAGEHTRDEERAPHGPPARQRQVALRKGDD